MTDPASRCPSGRWRPRRGPAAGGSTWSTSAPPAGAASAATAIWCGSSWSAAMLPEPGVMSVHAEAVDGLTTVVAIAGEITFSNVNGLGRELAGVLQAGARNLVIDLSDVAFIDSSGLSALL